MADKVPYVPDPISDVGSVQELLSYLRRELDRISEVSALGHAREIEFLHAAPSKVFEGLTVGADGTNWNPGGGQGVYTYYNSTWNKLG